MLFNKKKDLFPPYRIFIERIKDGFIIKAKWSGVEIRVLYIVWGC